MHGKIILSLIFMAFATVQLAHGKDTKQKELECYTCDSVQSCKSPKKEICNQVTANITRAHLQTHFPFITDHTTTDYECLKMSLSETNHPNNTVVSIRGCLHLGVFDCHNTPLNLSLTVSKDCHSCTKKLCNTAGTFSSSFSIMISSIFGLIIAKMFVM